LDGHGLLFGGVGKKGAHSGKLSGGGRSTKATRPAVGQEGAKVCGLDLRQRHRVYRLSTMAAEKINQPMRRSRISADGVRRATTVVLQMESPARGELPRRMV
jgi:hypothetical protein